MREIEQDEGNDNLRLIIASELGKMGGPPGGWTMISVLPPAFGRVDHNFGSPPAFSRDLYFPIYLGGLFSKKAVRPSRLSSVCTNTSINSSSRDLKRV